MVDRFGHSYLAHRPVSEKSLRILFLWELKAFANKWAGSTMCFLHGPDCPPPATPKWSKGVNISSVIPRQMSPPSGLS